MSHPTKMSLIFFFAGILLAGCGRILDVPSNPLPLSTGTVPTAQTPFASPIALLGETKDQWVTGPVIAIVSRRPLECFYCYFSIPPYAILYADGRHIIGYEGRLYEHYLSIQNVCELLTEIERSGFFEYTSAQYEEFYRSNHLKPGPAYYRINIDAWKLNSLNLLDFGFLFSQYKDTVEWPAALRVPYEELIAFDPNSMQPYMPEHIAIHIEKDPDLGFNLGTWTLQSPSLAELLARYNETATPVSELSEGEMILSGDEARAVLKQFNDRPWGGENIFVINNERYLVAVRALLPYEESGGRDLSFPLIPDPNTKYSPIPVNCSE